MEGRGREEGKLGEKKGSLMVGLGEGMIVRFNLETNLVLQQLQQDPLSTMREQVLS